MLHKMFRNSGIRVLHSHTYYAIIHLTRSLYLGATQSFRQGQKFVSCPCRKNTTKYSLNLDLVFNQKQGPFSIPIPTLFYPHRNKIKGNIQYAKRTYVCKDSLSRGQVQVPVFPSISAPAETEPKERFLFPSHFHFLFFHKKKKRKGKPFSHFFFSSPSFREVEEMALFLTFSLSLLFLFRRRGEEKEQKKEKFSPSLFSLFSFSPSSFSGEKEEKKNSFFPLSFSLWEKSSFLIPFPFSFLFLEEKEKEKTPSFLLLFGERKMGEKEWEKRKE